MQRFLFPRRFSSVQVFVNDIPVMVPEGSAAIQACEKAGVTIPRFCYHERLNIAGNCRMCLVDLEKSPKPIASCAFPVSNGLKIYTETNRVKKAREGVMEFLLANHPLDCPICDQGGECDLQDQSVRYGSDRSRFSEPLGKRAVEDKDLGPLVKTTMTRCIQCTRCVRFATEIAGAQELGSTGRGNDMQIGTYVEKALASELSGNVIDLCPVGALTSKPYEFVARPWELKKTETVDVHDAVGSNIRVDSRGIQVMRVLPRTNDDINQEWISDKTRFAYDGLHRQRLTRPLVKDGAQFVEVGWGDAFAVIRDKIKQFNGNEMVAVAGDLADAESMIVLKDFFAKLDSSNLWLDGTNGHLPPAHGTARSNYIFNSTINGLDEADAILLIGTNPRFEAPIMNARIRQNWLHRDVEIGLIGESNDLTYEFDHISTDPTGLQALVEGKHKYGAVFKNAKMPMIVVGSGVFDRKDASAVMSLVARLAEKHGKTLFQSNWNGFNVLQRNAGRTAALDIGFHATSAAKVEPKFVYLLNADVIPTIPEDAFVVYQGHHGDHGASIADVVLPGAAYTEKSATFANTEGLYQQTRPSVTPPSAAREDWSILRALSEVVLSAPLPYDDIDTLRERIPQKPAVDPLKALLSLKNNEKPSMEPFESPIKDFYLTNVITRASRTMAQCSKAFTK